MFRILRAVHAWAGVTLASLVILASLSGALLVWKQDFVALRLADSIVPFTPTTETLAAVAAAVEQRFDNRDILQIQFATEDFPLTRVALTDVRYAYVDGNGEVVDEWRQNERVEEWLYDLHHRLLLEDAGLTVLGVAAFAMLVVAVIGVIVYWPMRRGFRRGVWPSGAGRVPWLVSHRNLGIVIAVPLILILVTSVVLAFPRESERWLLEPFRGDDYSVDFSDHLDDISGGDSGDWLPAMQRALAAFPDARIRTATVPSDMSPYRVIGLQRPGDLHPHGKSQIYIDAREGWMDVRIDALDQHVSERLYNLSYPLHTGRVPSMTYRVALTIAGLASVLLGLSGLVAFVRRFVGQR